MSHKEFESEISSNDSASPFGQWLSTNYIPAPAEADQIRAYLSPQLAEVNRLSQVIDQLTEQKENLERHIAAHTALLSPARQLPEDIWRLIFVGCLARKHNAVMSISTAPVLLTHVCRGWRQLALETPLLWSSLHVVVVNDPTIDVARRKGAQMWLERAVGCPLSLSLTEVSPNMASRPEDDDYVAVIHDELNPVCSIVGLISEHRHHVKSLNLQLSVESFQNYMPMLVSSDSPSKLPVIESLSLQPWEDYFLGNGSRITLHPSFSFLHSLRHVSMSHHFTPHPKEIWTFNQLTSLILNDPLRRFDAKSIGGVLHLLAACPNLVHLSVDLADAQSSWGSIAVDRYQSLSDVTLTALTHLHVIDQTGRSPEYFFNHLNTPNLIEFSSEETCANSHSAPFLDSILRGCRSEMGSYPSLRALTLKCSQVTYSELISALDSSLSHLTLLSIQKPLEQTDCRDIIAWLSRRQDDTGRFGLPDLTEFEVTGDDFTYEQVFEMARLRARPSGGKLAKLTVNLTIDVLVWGEYEDEDHETDFEMQKNSLMDDFKVDVRFELSLETRAEQGGTVWAGVDRQDRDID